MFNTKTTDDNEGHKIIASISTTYTCQIPNFQKLAYLPFNGRVDLSSPQHVFHVQEDYGDDPSSAPLEPVRVFFGRLIGHGQRDLITHYAVKMRHFIGNTSMDAQLSFIMANQAKVYAPHWPLMCLCVCCVVYRLLLVILCWIPLPEVVGMHDSVCHAPPPPHLICGVASKLYTITGIHTGGGINNLVG